MVKVTPFGAYHYNISRFGKDVTRFVAPPYDVIDGSLEKSLKDDRLNITHITLGNEDDSYEVATRRMCRWLHDEVLVHDKEDSFYVYEQTFQSPDKNPRVRSGIIGLVKLEDFSTGMVLPHERTIPKHKADRMELLSAVKGNTEQIFMLYDDPSGKIEEMLQSVRKREELLRFLDNEGVHHRIIRIAEKDLIEKISSAMVPLKLLIADGHHRYETSLEYRDRMRAKDDHVDEDRPYDFVMATMVSFRNPGLVIYPTHRIVSGIDDATLDSLQKSLREDFDMVKSDGPEELADQISRGPDGAIGIWMPKKSLTLIAKSKGDLPKDNMERLSVRILQEKILKKRLGFTQDMLDKKVNIDYIKGTDTVMKIMSEGEHEICFFVKPPSADQVLAVAETGEKMPQKSTYFFPKIWSGTLLYLQ